LEGDDRDDHPMTFFEEIIRHHRPLQASRHRVGDFLLIHRRRRHRWLYTTLRCYPMETTPLVYLLFPDRLLLETTAVTILP
jgi:hypothetical protein